MAFYKIKFQMHQWYTKLINAILDFTYFYDTVCLTSNVIRKIKYMRKKMTERS